MDVVGMTAMPEAKLAREAEISYALLAMVTDYDCWHEAHEKVEARLVLNVMQINIGKALRLVARLAKDFPAEHETCPIGSDRALDQALVTRQESRDPAQVARLDAILHRASKD
jgi:5'-methylthioadenosine phosphorylase